jgi:hypothetical protein
LAAAAAILPFFDRASRGAIVLGGVLLLLWLPRVRVPAPLHRVFGVLAAASLYIYLSHYELYRPLMGHLPRALIVGLALAAGVVTWQLVRATTRAAGRLKTVALALTS